MRTKIYYNRTTSLKRRVKPVERYHQRRNEAGSLLPLEQAVHRNNGARLRVIGPLDASLGLL